MFEWYNIIHIIPLIVGIIMVFGSMLGLDVSHGDFDADLDTDHDMDHDILSLLGFGKCPVSLIITMLLLFFGATGLFINLVIINDITSNILHLITFCFSIFVSVVLTSVFSRVVAKFMPTLETVSVDKLSLLGSEGITMFDIDNSDASPCRIHYGGDIYQFMARSSGGKIESNTPIIVIEYDSAHDQFVVEPSSKLLEL